MKNIFLLKIRSNCWPRLIFVQEPNSKHIRNRQNKIVSKANGGLKIMLSQELHIISNRQSLTNELCFYRIISISAPNKRGTGKEKHLLKIQIGGEQRAEQHLVKIPNWTGQVGSGEGKKGAPFCLKIVQVHQSKHFLLFLRLFANPSRPCFHECMQT